MTLDNNQPRRLQRVRLDHIPDQNIIADPEPGTIAADRLDGAGEIAEYLYGADTVENRKKVHRVRKHGAPIGKFARRLVASKKKLDAHFDKVTG